jgi:uncharacterized protein YegJ (DUF2314 family)
MVKYELDNAEEMHANAPATFYLPPLETRANLKPNDIVKLVFRIEHDAGFDVERMWVKVKSVSPTRYIGILDNDPYCTNELSAGAVVEFEPKHVIQIHKP